MPMSLLNPSKFRPMVDQLGPAPRDRLTISLRYPPARERRRWMSRSLRPAEVWSLLTMWRSALEPRPLPAPTSKSLEMKEQRKVRTQGRGARGKRRRQLWFQPGVFLRKKKSKNLQSLGMNGFFSFFVFVFLFFCFRCTYFKHYYIPLSVSLSTSTVHINHSFLFAVYW